MNEADSGRKMLELAGKLGVPVSAHAAGVASLRFHDVRVIDLLPEMMIMIRSLVSAKEFAYRREAVTAMDRGLFISFQNIFSDGHETAGGLREERPHVRITPSHLPGEVRFPAHARVRQITVLAGMGYLGSFLGKDHQRFAYLFDADSTFWIEEFMSPEIAALVDELVGSAAEIMLPDAFYRLKALELLYFLFKNLAGREPVAHQHMSAAEIDGVYRVRNAMAASLDDPLPVTELARLSGMNELKLRRLFTQVFGKGLYPYFQHMRMQEAARLLKEEGLSVSEAGYRLGFSNLSHFGRLFEEHMGMKPKKWSAQR